MRRRMHLSVNILIINLIIYDPFSMAEPLRGHNMYPKKVPFVASIARIRPEYVVDRNHFCSGSLIAENLVLTAAHCLNNETNYKIDIVIGATDLKGARPKYDVQAWRTFKIWASQKNPDIVKHQYNDLAIVKLTQKLTNVTPASITTSRNTDLYGKNAWIIGWTPGQNGRGRFLNKAKVQILTPTQCAQRYQSITNKVYKTRLGELCTAAVLHTLATAGDSGAPLLDENNNILGITEGMCPVHSFNCTEEFADQHRFNFHVDFIDEYRQFIDEMKADTESVWIPEAN